MDKMNIGVFKRLVMDHTEEMTELAYALTQDYEEARRIVEDVLIEVWDERNIEDLTSAELNQRVRQRYTPKLPSFLPKI
jgi:DNA-directed RNA polymerase specialized sigma24 family protein